MASDNPTDQPPAPRIDRERLHRALAKARAALLAERGPHCHWEGELSSSALSTATAVTALELWQRAVPATCSRRPGGNESEAAAGSTPARAIESGLKWLAEHQNADGGWGDTTLSFSNISTTALCWAAFGAVPGAEQRWPETVRRAEAWLGEKCSVSSVQCSDPKPAASVAPTENWKLNTEHSPLSRSALITAIIARYGKDRTFSVPILTMCALAGRLGEGKEAWRRVIQLPFELAALPHKFFAALRLPVVSYALPALIAIGQVRHHHLPTRNPVLRLLRNRARAKTLRVLERIQPPGGGFLEATPLTSFVTMSLAGSGNADHPVALRGVEFLLKSMRADGSWPIDTNLATWVTTLAVNALGPSVHEVMSAEERGRILDWLLGQQYRTVHPYTNAAPGGWAWTDLPGGVPDADDTAGALLALKNLSLAPGFSRVKASASEGKLFKQFSADAAQDTRLKPGANESGPTGDETPLDPRVREAAIAGVKWLLDLQNRDGGIPTFCRGWTNLPFDRSSPDITAHALRAWLVWMDEMPLEFQRRLADGCRRAKSFLVWTYAGGRGHSHRSWRMTKWRAGKEVPPIEGWVPLWFGNQHHPREENPTYGTARVLPALFALLSRVSVAPATLGKPYGAKSGTTHTELSICTFSEFGLFDLVFGQQKEGTWGGACGPSTSLDVHVTVEETALAVEALAVALAEKKVVQSQSDGNFRNSLNLGAAWLVRAVEDDTWTRPAPIGFYFAKLWYYERLYPMVFTVAALEAVARLETTEPR